MKKIVFVNCNKKVSIISLVREIISLIDDVVKHTHYYNNSIHTYTVQTEKFIIKCVDYKHYVSCYDHDDLLHKHL